MTEQIFLKQFSELPDNLKKEVLAFFEILLKKHKKEIAEQPNQKKSDIEIKPTSGKSLPILKIERSGKPVALVFGSGKELVKYMADDFTAPLDDFKAYM